MDNTFDKTLKIRIFIVTSYFFFFFIIFLTRAFYLQIIIGDDLRIRQQQFLLHQRQLLLEQTLKSQGPNPNHYYKDIIQFNAPILYKRNVDSIIELAIRPASNKRDSDIFKKISSSADYLILAPELVSLYFDIALLTPKEQPLALGKETKWRWQVLAKKSGKSEFHISLNFKKELERSKYDTSYVNIDKEFFIETKWATFFYENWQWFWTMLLTLLLFAASIIAKPYESIISDTILKKFLGK